MCAQEIRFKTCIRFNNCNPEGLVPKCLYGRLDDFNRNRLTAALKSFLLSNRFQLHPSIRMHVKGLDFEGLCSCIQQEPWSRRFAKTKDNRRRNPSPWKEAKIKSLTWTERLDSWTWEKKLDYLVSFSKMVSSNSDINIRKLCLYVALVMKLLKLLGRKDLFRELIQILHYQ
jgi:hypothetical protein